MWLRVKALDSAPNNEVGVRHRKQERKGGRKEGKEGQEEMCSFKKPVSHHCPNAYRHQRAALRSKGSLCGWVCQENTSVWGRESGRARTRAF